MSQAVQYVAQKDPKGCAVACMAMLTGKTYDEIAEIVTQDFRTGGLGFWQVYSYLSKLGYAVAHRYRTSEPFSQHPHLCEVYVGTSCHFVVCLPDGRVYDPALGDNKRLSDYTSINYVTAVVPLNIGS